MIIMTGYSSVSGEDTKSSRNIPNGTSFYIKIVRFWKITHLCGLLLQRSMVYICPVLYCVKLYIIVRCDLSTNKKNIVL